MNFLESNPLLARYHMAQIIAEDLQTRATQALTQAKQRYQHNISPLIHAAGTQDQIRSEIQTLVTVESKSNSMTQFLDRSLRKISLDPNQNTQSVLTLDSIRYPSCDTEPLTVIDPSILYPPVNNGRHQALVELFNTISTTQPPLFLFTAEHISRYFLAPDSTPQLIKSTPFPTRLPYFFLRFIFRPGTTLPIIIFDIQPIPPSFWIK